MMTNDDKLKMLRESEKRLLEKATRLRQKMASCCKRYAELQDDIELVQKARKKLVGEGLPLVITGQGSYIQEYDG